MTRPRLDRHGWTLERASAHYAHYTIEEQRDSSPGPFSHDYVKELLAEAFEAGFVEAYEALEAMNKKERKK